LFIKKLRFWEKCLESNQTECFDIFHNLLDESVKAEIAEYLTGLGTKFGEYFPAMLDNRNWISNPFDDTAIFATHALATEEKGN
jgi:hypothetical protein